MKNSDRALENHSRMTPDMNPQAVLFRRLHDFFLQTRAWSDNILVISASLKVDFETMRNSLEGQSATKTKEAMGGRQSERNGNIMESDIVDTQSQRGNVI